MFQSGTRLNDTYVLMEQLGSGGGGIVYKAYHERLQTYVVVKQIRDRVKGILESRAEADILKNIKHTRLPRVYDFLEVDGEVFTVMDYIPGESMDRVLLREGRFEQEEVLKWAIQLADALDYLHSQVPPVIHSDIKPANVMLTLERDICLIDFNVSLAFDSGMKTSAGISGGYSPPEQYRDFNSYRKRLNQNQLWSASTQTMEGGNPTKELSPGTDTTQLMDSENQNGQTETESMISGMVGRGVDERSDIYSLGATLYHFLTGIRPEQDFEKIVRIQDLEIEISEGFSVIIGKMMELDPKKRYQNGSELLYALNHIYELDSEYQALMRKKRIKKIAVSFFCAAGVTAAISGFFMMKREKMRTYYKNVELAGTLMDSASYDEAEEVIQKSIEQFPKQIAAYEKELILLYSTGQYEESVRYGREILNAPPFECRGTEDEGYLGNIFYIVGNALFEQEEYSQAEMYFSESIKKNQKNPLYFRDYAITLAKTGKIEPAKKELETAVSLELGKDSIYMVQGEIAFAENENETAMEKLYQSVQTAESSDLKRRAVLLYARVCERQGSSYLNQEISMLEQAEREFGIQVSMHLSERLADAYARKAKDSTSGREYYEKALEKFERLYQQGYATRQMMENIAVIYQQMDELEQAEQILLKMQEKYPDDYHAFKRLAFLEADIQQKRANADRNYDKMKSFYEKAMKLYEEKGQSGDTEMQMLETMMQDLKEGGWF